MRVILAGGGTGGHVIPALAIAQELKRRYSAEIVFIGTSRGIENRLVPGAGYRLERVEIGALKKVSLATRLKTLFDLPRAILRAKTILDDFRPDVVIGVGGYASGPAMLAAVLSGVPTLAFEPNVVPGFANKVVGVMVSAAAVQFPQTCRYFQRCRVTGVPVRQDFFKVGSAPEHKPLAGCAEQCTPTLLVFGGSQGAHAINQALIDSLDSLQREFPSLRIIHQLGEKDYEQAQSAYLQSGVKAELYPFISDMWEAFRKADLIVCRSGASTVAEITAAAKPAIFIPFPHAADDHQTRNAEALVKAGAAVLLRESELSPERLVGEIKSLFADRTKLVKMAEAARRVAHPDAAGEIANMAARLAGEMINAPESRAFGSSGDRRV
ncbi:MAG TPA: undecaprenyldiphospho-muramoylpentapeptide beta-N-acetylglucosaminyltransferase [Terriglobales bacterium]|nr:undecaprenyldiphospho-muramoylpentapeptide beta-N-acetylglucosaminyltransferase [Terriglobales bacterium]